MVCGIGIDTINWMVKWHDQFRSQEYKEEGINVDSNLPTQTIIREVGANLWTKTKLGHVQRQIEDDSEATAWRIPSGLRYTEQNEVKWWSSESIVFVLL